MKKPRCALCGRGFFMAAHR
ncbi:hypothetical protein [Kosakonia oryzae]|uniref:Uncharacterized protein n=1 Tax=Kosakonia oryzae TaxID=497725 RepID=A0ABX7PYI5_9ENTR|nr:hypothetical protein AWR26_25250 [Kosakonia oryzae]UDJ85211.1 hypothetical protein I5186_22975 [Kosakonia oryzae]